MNNYGLDKDMNLVLLSGSGKRGRPKGSVAKKTVVKTTVAKRGRPKGSVAKKPNSNLKLVKHTTKSRNIIEEIDEYENTGHIVKGGFLFDLLSTGANMIKNAVEGKRWSDNTVFKGLGQGGCACSKEVEDFEKHGRITTGGFLLDFLATGINMIKNGIEGKRWSDNTVFKGLGKNKNPACKRKVSHYHKMLGLAMKKGFSMKEAQAFLKKTIVKK